MALVLTVSRVAGKKPVNHVPDFFNLVVSTVPPTSCRALTVQIGSSIAGILDPGSPISTIIVPVALWDQILNHACPYKLDLDYTVNQEGMYSITNVTIEPAVPSLLLSVATDLANIKQDSKEISEKAGALSKVVADIDKALSREQEQLAGAKGASGVVVPIDAGQSKAK